MAFGQINPQPPLGGGHPPPPATGSGQFKGGALGAWQANPPLGWIPFGSRAQTIPTLAPGTGFAQATPQPPTIGSRLPGGDAKAIARWDVIPHQRFTELFSVGVVAFHMNGIKEVQFSLNGGNWSLTREMSYNPRTKVTEYWVNIDPKTLPQGLCEIRAIVIPKIGIPRVLQGRVPVHLKQCPGADAYTQNLSFYNGNHSMFLFADGEDTYPQPKAWCAPTGNDDTGEVDNLMKPFKTIEGAFKEITITHSQTQANNAVVYLEAGDYKIGAIAGNIPKTELIWATVQPAEGVDKNSVRIIETVKTGAFTDEVHLIRYKDLTCQELPPVTDYNYRFKGSFIWFDSCDLFGAGLTVPSVTWSNFAWGCGAANAAYATNCFITNTRNGLRDAFFLRNIKYGKISGVMMGANAPFGVNLIANEYNNEGYTPFHGDVVHWYPKRNDRENFIVYNVQAYRWENQSIFCEFQKSGGLPEWITLDNIAVVNVHCSQDKANKEGGEYSEEDEWNYLKPNYDSTGKQFSWKRNTNHLLIWQCTHPGHRLLLSFEAIGSSPAFTINNLSIIGNLFYRMGGHNDKYNPFGPTTNNKNVVIEDNHFIDPSDDTQKMGSNVTNGDPLFKNPNLGGLSPTGAHLSDYHVQQSSPCHGKVPKITQADVENTIRNNFSDKGAWELK